MADDPNVFWKTAIDFRDFDISGRFSFQNDIDRPIPVFGSTLEKYEDQITIRNGLGGGNPSFLGGGVTVSGGTVNFGRLDLYVDNRPGGFDGYISPSGSISMDLLNEALDSASRRDDQAFLREMLVGNDTMVFSGGPSGAASADYAFGAAGNDSIDGNGGNDTLFGNSGIDRIEGGAGRDWLYGGTQTDFLLGGNGRDVIEGGRGGDGLIGGAGADTLIGGPGNDGMGGESGRDTFLFRKGAGDDLIRGWEEGLDRIRVETGVNLKFAIDYSGTGAVVTFTKGRGFLDQSITIEDVADNSLQLTERGDVFFLT